MDRLSPQFRQLRDKWYKKLLKSGFKDLETTDDLDKRPWLAHYDPAAYIDPLISEAGSAYTSKCLHFLRTYDWKNHPYKKTPRGWTRKRAAVRDRAVWELYSEGQTYSAIAKRCGLHRSTVLKIVHRFDKIMMGRRP